jgi:hypothetical protein
VCPVRPFSVAMRGRLWGASALPKKRTFWTRRPILNGIGLLVLRVATVDLTIETLPPVVE